MMVVMFRDWLMMLVKCIEIGGRDKGGGVWWEVGVVIKIIKLKMDWGGG